MDYVTIKRQKKATGIERLAIDTVGGRLTAIHILAIQEYLMRHIPIVNGRVYGRIFGEANTSSRYHCIISEERLSDTFGWIGLCQQDGLNPQEFLDLCKKLKALDKKSRICERIEGALWKNAAYQEFLDIVDLRSRGKFPTRLWQYLNLHSDSPGLGLDIGEYAQPIYTKVYKGRKRNKSVRRC